MPYEIQYTSPAERAIRVLDRSIQHRILKKIEAIAEAPRGFGSIKLAGQDAYRVRVGDYRIIYSILDDRVLIIIVDVGHRREIYRGL